MESFGEKIKSLRKQKNVSQEVFANYLGVSFQAVSKWENGITMPDVTMIPAIASFFGISTDELFDFNRYETEKKVEAIVEEHSKYWDTDKAKAEKIIRDGLKQYPGNDVLLNCLIGVLPLPEKSNEVITVAKSLIEGTRFDDVRLDAYRIMAEAYIAQGEYLAAKNAIEQIPELYFSKLEVAAELLNGEEKYEAAQKQKMLSAQTLIEMLLIAGKYLAEQGEPEKAASQFRIAQKVIDAFADDFLEAKWFRSTLYDRTEGQREEIKRLLNAEAWK